MFLIKTLILQSSLLLCCHKFSKISYALVGCAEYRKWRINHHGRLFKNNSFWMGVCSDWVLNRIYGLLENKKIKTTKSVTQVDFSQKITKVLPKLITKILLFLQFKLALSFNRALIRNLGVNEKHFPQKLGVYSNWALN